MFGRKKPCKTCPFRIGGDGIRGLGRDRAEEVADTLRSDQTFACHDDIHKPKSDRQHCAGAAIILEKEESPNQMMRIAERIGLYDRHQLVGHDEVFGDFDEWIESQE